MFKCNLNNNIDQGVVQQEAESEIELTYPKEMIKEIKENTNPRKASGYDRITGEVLKQFPRE